MYKFTYALYWFSFIIDNFLFKMLWKGQSFYEMQIRKNKRKQKNRRKWTKDYDHASHKRES